MLWSVRRKLLDYLVSVTLASGLGLAAPGLEHIPESVVEEVLADAEEADWDTEDRLKLLQILSLDERPRVREAVARVLAAAPDPGARALGLLRALATDHVAAVRQAAAAALSESFTQLPPLQRLEVACEWAVADEPNVRLAMAHALATAHAIPAADLVLTHLVYDPVHQIRMAALRAASLRFELDAPTLRAVAEPVLHDPDRRVREAARRAFRASLARG
jgi:HEAT repeat protein